MKVTKATTTAVLGALVMLGGTAYAQLSTHDQKCIDAYNNGLRLVSQQAGKSASSCIKNAGKGKETDPEKCVVDNTDGKLGGKETKVEDLFTTGGKCDPVPADIVQQAATGISAHEAAIEQLLHFIFGSPISGVNSPGAAVAKCQDTAILGAAQLATTAIKVFRQCAKDGMKTGSIKDAPSLLQGCIDVANFEIRDDSRFSILKAANKFQTIFEGNGACADPTLYTSCADSPFGNFTGGCSKNPAEAATDLGTTAVEAAFRAVSEADGL